jgi:dolichol kinase
LQQPVGQWVLLSLAGLIFACDLLRLNYVETNKLLFRFFAPALRPEEWWHITGASYVLWGATATAFCFPLKVSVAALIFLALGDAASGVVGNYYNSRVTKSLRLYRSVACFFACLAAASVAYYSGLGLSLYVLTVGAISATVVESASLLVNDNISVPLVSALTMYLTSLCF